MTLEEIRGEQFRARSTIKDVCHTKQAEQIMEYCRFRTLTDTDEILFYDNGVYLPKGDVIIKEECEKRIEECSNYIVNQVLGTIKRSTYTKRESFDQDQDIICLKNGLLNIRTGELSQFTEKVLCRNQIPVEYDPKTGPIKFMKFLIECLPDYRDRITVIEEFANILIKQPNFEKVAMYIGTGENGKSKFLELIENFLGIDNYANVSLHDLNNERFATARLDGKLANIYPDIANTELKNLGRFKALVSGDPIDAEKKGKDQFRLKNQAKMLFSANQIPEIDEDSDAVYRRFLVTEWTQQFRRKPDPEKEIYQRDNNLLEKLCTEEEFSGILNLLIKTAQRMLKQNGFTYEPTIDQVRKTMKEQADPIQMFCNNCLVVDPKEMLPKSNVYRVYGEWCRKNQQIIKHDRTFNAKLKQTINVEDDIQKLKGKTTRVWRGIKFSSSVTEVTSLDTY